MSSPSETAPGSGDTSVVANNRAVRLLWFLAGWIFVGIGGLGVVLPVLPTTPFFIAAAFCFSRSSRRFELWVLNLPGVGPMVRDYRSGLGVARRVKLVAIAMIVVVGSLSTCIVASRQAARPWMAVIVVVLCLMGMAHIWWIIPTREKVLAAGGPGDVPAGARS